MSFEHLPGNAFDAVLVAVLVIGVLRGRRHGMSEELLQLLKWLAVLFGCWALYELAGTQLAQVSPLSRLTCFLIAYIAIALVIFGLFALLTRMLGGKLLGSDLFGRAEYYLGMGSGLLRYGCILLVGLALLNARGFTAREVQMDLAQQKELYGSDFFPGLHSVQELVFERSLSGPYLKQYCGFLFIKSTVPENKELHQREAKLPY